MQGGEAKILRYQYTGELEDPMDRLFFRFAVACSLAVFMGAIAPCTVTAGLFDSPQQRAVKDINALAVNLGITLDVLGVRWAESKADVLKKRPNATEVTVPFQDREGLMELSDFFGVPCGKLYVFRVVRGTGAFTKLTTLQQVVVTFSGNPTRSRFDSHQEKLSRLFGPLPAPAGQTLEQLEARKEFGGRFELTHRIMQDTPAGAREQIIFVRF